MNLFLSLSVLFISQFSLSAEINITPDNIQSVDQFDTVSQLMLNAKPENDDIINKIKSKTIPPTTAQKKALSTALAIDSGIDSNQARRNGGPQQFWQWIDVSMKYKLESGSSISIAQGFDYFYNKQNPESGQNRLNPYLPVVRYSFHRGGIFGSEELSPTIRYYIPVSYNRMAAESKMLGIIGLDINPEWKISSRWSTSYYLSTRANLVSRDNQWQDQSGNFNRVPTAVRVLQGPSINYKINDEQSLSTSAMLDQMFDYNQSLNFAKEVEFTPYAQTTDRTLTNRLYLSTGYSQSLKIQSTKVTLNPYLMKTGNLRQDYQFRSENESIPETQWWNQDNLTYNLYFEISY